MNLEVEASTLPSIEMTGQFEPSRPRGCSAGPYRVDIASIALSRDIPETWLSAIVIRIVLHIPVVMAEAALWKIASVVPPPDGTVMQ